MLLITAVTKEGTFKQLLFIFNPSSFTIVVEERTKTWKNEITQLLRGRASVHAPISIAEPVFWAQTAGS